MRIRFESGSGFGSGLGLDSDPDLVWIRIQIDKKAGSGFHNPDSKCYLSLGTIRQGDNRIVGIHMNNGDCAIRIGDCLDHTGNILPHLEIKENNFSYCSMLTITDVNNTGTVQYPPKKIAPLVKFNATLSRFTAALYNAISPVFRCLSLPK
jgi:hypothetical protein